MIRKIVYAAHNRNFYLGAAILDLLSAADNIFHLLNLDGNVRFGAHFADFCQEVNAIRIDLEDSVITRDHNKRLHDAD